MTSSDRTTTYRSTAMDRVFAEARTIAVIGPCVTLDEDAIRKALTVAEQSTATPRLAVEPDTHTVQWRYRRNLGERTPIAHLPAEDSRDLGHLMGVIRRRPGVREPLEVVIAGDYIAVDYSHGVGDGQMGVLLLATLGGNIDFGRAPALAKGLPSNTTWTAIRHHYLSRPAALRDFWRLRKQNKKPPRLVAGATKRIEDWESGKTSRADFMAPDRVAQLKKWASTQPGKATTASVTIALWIAALEAEGVTVDESVMILFNSRRYLPPKLQDGHGNFAVGIPVRIPPSPSATDIAALMRQVIDSGWPIAILGMSQIKAALKRSAPAAHASTEPSIEVNDRIRLAVSDLGKLTMFDDGLWIRDERPPRLAAFLEPDGPDGATLLVSEIDNGRTFTASFCDKMIDPAVIESALRRMCDDPVGTLQAEPK
ncbi:MULTISPECIES: hypothetical protein [Nocardiaceae]|uniref:hypothetical protein n=1 Tax=Nocardiaceae TaxID=85025 RepID=UPI001E2960A1|nr:MULTISPECIES: hypothetical protein [Rhodococcus]